MAKAAIEKVTQAATDTVTEQPKEKDMYKLTYGNFESQKDAIKQLSDVKEKIVHASLIIEGNSYKIFFGEYDKATGNKALETVKGAGYEAELI